MAHHDGPIAHPKRFGRAHIFKIPRAKKFCPDQTRKRRPAEDDGQGRQKPKAAPQYRCHNDDDVKRWQSRKNFKEPLEQKIRPPAKIPLHRPGDDADDRRENGHHQREND